LSPSKIVINKLTRCFFLCSEAADQEYESDDADEREDDEDELEEGEDREAEETISKAGSLEDLAEEARRDVGLSPG